MEKKQCFFFCLLIALLGFPLSTVMAEADVNVSFTSNTFSDFFKSYSVTGGTVELSSSYSSLTSGTGGYLLKLDASPSGVVNTGYMEIKSTAGKIKKVEIDVTANASNAAIRPTMLGWATAAGATSATDNADFVITQDHTGGSSYSNIADAATLTYDITDDATVVRFYRQVKKIKVGGSTTNADYGLGKTVRVWAVRVYLEAASDPLAPVLTPSGNTTQKVTVNNPISAITITSDKAATWDVSPALPAGITGVASGDGKTYTISGTPTAVKAATDYTVTATSAGHSANATVNLTVKEVSTSTDRHGELKSEITTLEPLKGIVLWPSNDKMNTLKNSIALEYSYCLPCAVVTGKSGGKINYDWSSFEALLDDITSRDHQAIIRFRIEYPGEDGAISSGASCLTGVAGSTAVPQYIRDIPGYTETFNADAGGDGPTYYADWSNSELKWFLKQFYTDFAAKYDNDPRIAFIQVGFGHWSEYHTYGTDPVFDVNFPSKAYQSEFLQHINSTFVNTPWSISIDAYDDSYTPIAASSTLMGLNFGLFDDSFMHSEHDISQGDGWNETEWNGIGQGKRWKTAPCGGEISYYTANDQKKFLNPAGMYGVTWEQAAAKYHMTYVIGNDAPTGSYATAARVLQAGQNAGYSLEVTDYILKSNSAIVQVTNNGVAPLYHDAFVTVKGVRSDISLKGLLPGDTIDCEVTGITIADDETPAVTITSDKLLEGKTIPYKADLEAIEPTTAVGETSSEATIAWRQTGNSVILDGADVEFMTLYSSIGTRMKTVSNTNEISTTALAKGSIFIVVAKVAGKDALLSNKFIKP